MEQLRHIFIIPWFVATAVSFFATPIVIKFAKRLGIVDDPTKNKHPKVIHTYPIPRGGGIPIFLSLFVSVLVFLPADRQTIGIVVGALALVVMGFLDDKYNLNPYLRLTIGLVAASIPVFCGIGISFISNPLGGIIDLTQPQAILNIFNNSYTIFIFGDILAVLWITFLMNIVNMGAKGVDGQMSGVTVIATLTIAFLSLRYSADITQWPVIILAAITSGAYLGFLPWHVFPQKIMPGYGGSTLAGYLLAVLSILSTTKVGALMVVLGVPLIDTGYTVVRRIVSGKSPVWGDRGHLHHRLLDFGMTKQQVAVFYWVITGVLGFLALNLNTTTKIYTMIGIAAIIGGLILWLTYRPKKQSEKNL